MSRVIFVSTAPDDAREACRKRKVPVSVIEALPSGGSRVVLKSPAATALMRQAFGRNVIADDTLRHPLTSRRMAS